MLLLPLVVALLLHTPLTAQWDYKDGGQDYKDELDYKNLGQDYKDGGSCCGWKCMLFTLQWPGSFCQILYNETLCKIPPNVNNWTIHGLWSKHGVCASCVEELRSPQKYFRTCLQLRERFNVHSLLEREGITPSNNKTYEVDQIREVVAPLFGDHHEIQCFQDKKGRELWFQMKVSLSPNGTSGCSPSDLNWAPEPPLTHPCPPDTPLYYPPIEHGP
ncbi:ribonuclease T2-like [Boleophthalmus pectinirostris]|uniref:ribonuclease T2-like n=1 Tax=Boleophthalmus pectinirostris TaxID=150288 RepID=UPI00243015A3|nr:ribonuclease T2-like [Boleophthalmus pectinirostris]